MASAQSFWFSQARFGQDSRPSIFSGVKACIGKRFGVKDGVWERGLGFTCPFETRFCSAVPKFLFLVWKNALGRFWDDERVASEMTARSSHADSGQGLALQRFFSGWEKMLGGV